MFKEICFTEEWLQSFKKQAAHRKIDVIILEKMIYALHLLEQLQQHDLKFTFKGGTSLILLLEEIYRFSIDIGIISNTNKTEMEEVFYKVIHTSKFTSFKLDEHRSYKSGIPKAHYIFNYESTLKGAFSGNLLLDILIEEVAYPETIQKAIKAKWIETSDETFVLVPTIDAITGDKLTAFAPNTIGIPYQKGGFSASLEICKQLFDLGKLFDQISNFKIVAESFRIFANREIEYRKETRLDLTPEEVLLDTIETCLIITKREKGNPEQLAKFKELQKGITAFSTGYLMSANFRIDDAIIASAKVAYLAAKILTNDLTQLHYYLGEDVQRLSIENQEWNFINRLKRQADKSSFFYWYQCIQLLTNKNIRID